MHPVLHAPSLPPVRRAHTTTPARPLLPPVLAPVLTTGSSGFR